MKNIDNTICEDCQELNNDLHPCTGCEKMICHNCSTGRTSTNNIESTVCDSCYEMSTWDHNN